MSRPLKVLLVDDDAADVLLIQDALRATDRSVEITVADDGVEALRHLHETVGESGAPDLIVLDLNMPRMDGRELLAVLKSSEELQHIPVVVLTTSSRHEDVVACYRNHANAYITKPIDLDQFDEVIQRIDHFFSRVAQLPEPEQDVPGRDATVSATAE